MVIKWQTFLLILGRRRLRRSTRRLRRILRELPIPLGMTLMEDHLYPLPKELTGVRTPMRLREETALSLRESLEAQVLFQENLERRMTTVIGLGSRYPTRT